MILSHASQIQPAPEGFPDLVGWRTVTITPEMVGQRLAVFAAVEVKSATGRLAEAQSNMLDAVDRAGGIALLSRSPQTASYGLETMVSGRDQAGKRARRPASPPVNQRQATMI